MVDLIRAETRLQAWKQAAKRVLEEDDLNIVLEITKPKLDTAIDKKIRLDLDAIYAPHLDGKKEQLPINSIAETIFPYWEWTHRGMKGVYQNYIQQYDVLKKRKQNWGTYAFRMSRVPLAGGSVLEKDGVPVNPLEYLTEKLRRESVRAAPHRACYELSIYRPEFDRTQGMGGPCLSHLSFKLIQGHIHLTALYRSHDYCWKVPGNLLGLARLQYAVAKEIGLDSGPLVVHSTRAFMNGAPAGFRRYVRELA